MSTREEAIEAVESHLREMQRVMNNFGSALPGHADRAETELVVTRIDENDIGWVFSYNTRAYAETGNFIHALGGNAPIIVARSDGQLYITGTAEKLDFYLDEFRRGKRTPINSTG
jgi:hypothetical protein